MYLLKWDGIDFKKDFSLKVLSAQLFLSFFMFLWVTGFILGWSLTLTSHADIMYFFTIKNLIKILVSI